VLVVPPQSMGDGTDDHLIEGFMIDDDLAGMIADCCQGDKVKVIEIADRDGENNED
jgi:hypothetical protein